MKKARLLALGAAPGLVLGYLLLAGYLIRRVNPMPITFIPEGSRAFSRRLPRRSPS